MSWLKKAGKKVGHGISKNWKKLTGRYHKGKHHKKCNSIFSSGCCGVKKSGYCGGPRGLRPASSCGDRYGRYGNYPMNNNMMAGMFNNIINRLISVIQSFSSQPLNTYNNYNYNNQNIYNTTYDNDVYNTVYDNDIINNSINGVGNSILADA